MGDLYCDVHKKHKTFQSIMPSKPHFGSNSGLFWHTLAMICFLAHVKSMHN